MLDRQGTIVAVNAAWERFGQENQSQHLARAGVGTNYLDVCRNAAGVFQEEAKAALAGIQAVLQGACPLFELEYPCHSPEVQRWFLMHATPLSSGMGGVIVAHVDITERKLAEERLREAERLRAEAEKLAVTGRMAAEVAHEINNPLAGIKNSFRLIKDAVPADHPDRDMVGRIEREIDRIANIVRQMYQIYSPRTEKLIDIPVGEIVRNVLELLEPLLREYETTVELGAIGPELTVRVYEGSPATNLVQPDGQRRPGIATGGSRVRDCRPGRPGLREDQYPGSRAGNPRGGPRSDVRAVRHGGYRWCSQP